MPRPAAAQATEGSFQISSVAGLSGNRQSISTNDSTSTVRAGDSGFTSLTLGLEAEWFLAPRLGVGAVVSYQRISFDQPLQDAVGILAGGYYGPIVTFRLPLDERATFVLSASGGGTRTVIVNRNTGLAQDVDIDAVGQYWMAGGGVSFRVASNASIDAGLRYQSSRYASPDQGRTASVTAAGLLTSAGFSLYFK